MLLRALLVFVAVFGSACNRSVDGDDEATNEQRAFWSQPVNTDRLDAFVLANARFALLHEMAHSIVDDFKIPVAGRPEDAADRLAISLMTPRQSTGRPEDEVPASPKASELVWVAYFWINMGKAGVQERDEIPWFAEHGIDEQRGFQVLCLLYGSDPARFTRLADEYALPEARRRTCVAEAADNDAAWRTLVGSNVLDEAERQRAYAEFQQQDRIVTSQPAGVLYSEHQPIELFMNVPWFPWNSRSFLQRHRLLEATVTELLSLRRQPGSAIPWVSASSCDGVQNAFYSPNDRTIMICYPLVDRFSWSGRHLLWTVEQEARAESR